MSAIYEVSVEGVHNLMMELDAMRRRAEAAEANLAKTKLALDAEKALADRFRAHQAIGDRLAEQQKDTGIERVSRQLAELVRVRAEDKIGFENLRDRNREMEKEAEALQKQIADLTRANERLARESASLRTHQHPETRWEQEKTLAELSQANSELAERMRKAEAVALANAEEANAMNERCGELQAVVDERTRQRDEKAKEIESLQQQIYDLGGANVTLAERTRKAEAVALAKADEVAEAHAVLDADPSRIIRNAKGGYPEGREPRELSLAERIAALCRYASDYSKWCAKKEEELRQLRSGEAISIEYKLPIPDRESAIADGLKKLGWKSPQDVAELTRQRDEMRATIADCPLLHTTTCNVAERNWIARAKQHLAK